MSRFRSFQKFFLPAQFLWRGSTIQLLSVIIIPLALLILVFAAGSTWLHQVEMRMMLGERNQLAANAAARTLASELHHRESAVLSIAVSLPNTTLPLESVPNFFNFHAADFDHGIAIFLSDGTQATTTGDPAFWANSEIQEQIHLGSTSSSSSEIWIDGNPYLLFLASSADGAHKVAGVESTERFIQDIFENIAADQEGSNISIINHAGKRIFSSDPSFVSLNFTMDDSNHEGMGIYTENGKEFILATSQIPEMNWVLALEEPWNAITEPSLATSQTAPLILLPLVIITLAGLWFGARQIVQPLRDLERRTAALVWGDTTPIEQHVGGIAEIRELQDELIHMAKMVQTAQQGLRGYIGAITEAQEEERRRLARELHDETLQSIIALKQRVQLAQKSMPDEKSEQTLVQLAQTAEETIQNIRRITRALRPIYLEDLGLVTALEMLLKELTKTNSLEVTFRSRGVERRLSQPAEIAIFRVTQEALSNITRHANASKVQLTIDFQVESVQLTVQDNGIGFEIPNTPGAFAPAGHYGLLGMYERANLIGASLNFTSKLREGTKLVLTLPTA